MSNMILVIEDDRSISELICMNLEVAGYEVRAVSDGREAAEHLPGSHHYDLALVDIMLPGIDGFELMEYFKRYEIPVIYLTAKADLSSKVKGLRAGAEDYIVKPFEMLELLVRIEKVLERTGRQQEFLSIGELKVEVARRKVVRAGEEISLKPLEYDLLLMLLRNKNRILTRQQLLQTVWGEDYMGETRTIDVHIGRLRRKTGLQQQIRTIPKVGYCLEDTGEE